MSETTEPSGVEVPAPKLNMRTAVEIAVRLTFLCLLIVWCLWIVALFVEMVVWGLIIAIAADGLYGRLTRAMGGRRKLAATIIVLLALALLVVPAVMLSETLISGAQHFAGQLESEGFHVPPPPEKVMGWPLVGDTIYNTWLSASENLTKALEPHKPQLIAASHWFFGVAGSVGVGLLQLVGSLIVAGIFLALSEGREIAFKRLARRLGGERGAEFVDLANATVRSYASHSKNPAFKIPNPGCPLIIGVNLGQGFESGGQ